LTANSLLAEVILLEVVRTVNFTLLIKIDVITNIGVGVSKEIMMGMYNRMLIIISDNVIRLCAGGDLKVECSNLVPNRRY
jgi:hypothetical protein